MDFDRVNLTLEPPRDIQPLIHDRQLRCNMGIIALSLARSQHIAAFLADEIHLRANDIEDDDCLSPPGGMRLGRDEVANCLKFQLLIV